MLNKNHSFIYQTYKKVKEKIERERKSFIFGVVCIFTRKKRKKEEENKIK